MEPVIIVHGGAGDITDAEIPDKIKGIKISVRKGFAILKNGGSALDAVEEAIKSMEINEHFNAGYGSCLNTDGKIEMDASIMNGDLKSGCVTLLHDIMHPISVARKIMENTNHAFLGGEKAMQFARNQNFEILPQGSLITQNAKNDLEQFLDRQSKGLETIFSLSELDKKEYPGEPGTVGAVAIDIKGNIAAGTSTGGLTGKIPGRIGDTPILGSGTYADNNIGGVSATGHGETVMRYNLSQRILQKMYYENINAQESTEYNVKEMTKRLIRTGGAITISKVGDIGIFFLSKNMPWACIKGDELLFGISQGDKFIETFE